MNKIEVKSRNSSVELLKIICIFGIISMHSFGRFYGTCQGINLVYGNAINSLFNIGVSVFMLITGYYSTNFSINKIFNYELIIIFYSILDLIVSAILKESVPIKVVLRSLFPIATRKYWYMSVYIIIVCLSDYLNMICEKLDRKHMRRLLLVLILFFYLMPSFLYFQIIEDTGKGVVNMLIVYLIGRYIRTYYNESISPLKLFGQAILAFMICFLGNLFFSLIAKQGEGLFCPWARDNSIFILFGAIYIFLMFKNISFHSKLINSLAECIFATYLLERTVRDIFDYFLDWSQFERSNMLAFIILLYVLFVMAICIGFESVRKCTIGKLENKIYTFFKNKYYLFHKKIEIMRRK